MLLIWQLVFKCYIKLHAIALSLSINATAQFLNDYMHAFIQADMYIYMYVVNSFEIILLIVFFYDLNIYLQAGRDLLGLASGSHGLWGGGLTVTVKK